MISFFPCLLIAIAVWANAALAPAKLASNPHPSVTAGDSIAETKWFYKTSLSETRFARLFDSLTSRGFHPVSMDLFERDGSRFYAASWARESDAEPDRWIRIPAQPEAAFHASLQALAARGYRPALLSACEPAPSPAEGKALFAAILKKDSGPSLTLTGLSQPEFQTYCDSAQRHGAILAWMKAYGPPEHARYAGLWIKNNEGIAWNYSIGDNPTSLAAKMDVFSKVWVRPAFVAPMPGGLFFTLWQENSIGPWEFHAALDEKVCAKKLEEDAALGLHPIGLFADRTRASAGNSPANEIAFTALIAGQARALPRQWTVTGPAAPGLEAFDAYMRDLMRAYQVRGGALAMAHDGKLVFAHGYTWAEFDYPQTQPASLFRVASCSKPLTSMVVHKLICGNSGVTSTPTFKDKVLSILHPIAKDKIAQCPSDPRFEDITIDELLTHSAGWVRSHENPDPVFNDFPLGSEIQKRLPPARADFLPYMLRQPLQFEPGSRCVYDNFGYFLLGRIIETLPMGAGKTYEEAAEDLLFKPLGLTRPRFGGSLVCERAPEEVLYHTKIPYLQANRDPKGPRWVPGAYGDFDLRNMDAAGAWLLSAPDYAKVLASFDMGDGNPILKPDAVAAMWSPAKPSDAAYKEFLRGWFALPVKNASNDTLIAKWHNGLFPGSSTLVFYRPDHWSFALFLNQDIPPQLSQRQARELNRLANEVKTWPTTDLFPEFGIPAFTPGHMQVTVDAGHRP